MKSLLLSFTCAVCFSLSISAQSFTEGADLPGTGTGPAFTVSGTGITIAGTVNTPVDGQDRFQVIVPFGCFITGVTYSVTDTANITVTGFFQFGPTNQQNFPPLTGSFASGPTGPFPVTQGTYDCMIAANIAANDSWSMTFSVMCTNGIDAPGLSSGFSVYPNPANDEFFVNGNLQSGEQGIIVMENVFGQEILSSTISPGEKQIAISTATIASGVYFCKMIVDGELRATEKIVVQH
jgi:hypothetical protein